MFFFLQNIGPFPANDSPHPGPTFFPSPLAFAAGAPFPASGTRDSGANTMRFHLQNADTTKRSGGVDLPCFFWVTGATMNRISTNWGVIQSPVKYLSYLSNFALDLWILWGPRQEGGRIGSMFRSYLLESMGGFKGTSAAKIGCYFQSLSHNIYFKIYIRTHTYIYT